MLRCGYTTSLGLDLTPLGCRVAVVGRGNGLHPPRTYGGFIMAVHPCESRRYLGIGDGDGQDRCQSPITHRVKFIGGDSDAECTVGIAYFCRTHAVETLTMLANVFADTEGGSGIIGTDVTLYTPRTAERAAALEGVAVVTHPLPCGHDGAGTHGPGACNGACMVAVR